MGSVASGAKDWPVPENGTTLGRGAGGGWRLRRLPDGGMARPPESILLTGPRASPCIVCGVEPVPTTPGAPAGLSDAGAGIDAVGVCAARALGAAGIV